SRNELDAQPKCLFGGEVNDRTACWLTRSVAVSATISCPSFRSSRSVPASERSRHRWRSCARHWGIGAAVRRTDLPNEPLVADWSKEFGVPVDALHDSSRGSSSSPAKAGLARHWRMQVGDVAYCSPSGVACAC